MDFRGGTYVSQVQSMELYHATLLWAEHLDLKEIKYLGPSSKDELILQIRDSDNYPTLIDGMDNVWCLTFSIKQGFILVNIVES